MSIRAMTLLQKLKTSPATSTNTGLQLLIDRLESKLQQPLAMNPDLIDGYIMQILKREGDAQTDPEAGSRHLSTSTALSVEVYKDDRIAVMDISGPLTNRTEYAECSNSPVSYEELSETIDALVELEYTDCVLRIDSGGGEASKLFELSDKIHALQESGEMNFYAVIDDHAYSAAYGIASACGEIYISQTSGVGSVGVRIDHYSYAGALSKAGIDVTIVTSGKFKADGDATQPLSDTAKAKMQETVDSLNEVFTATVSRNLGVDQDAIKALEAGCFRGQDAIDKGLAHAYGNVGTVLSNIRNGETLMTKDEIKKLEGGSEDASASESGIGGGTQDIDTIAEKLESDDKFRLAVASAIANSSSGQPNASAEVDSDDPEANSDEPEVNSDGEDGVQQTAAEIVAAEKERLEVESQERAEVEKQEADVEAETERVEKITNMCVAAGFGESATKALVSSGSTAEAVGQIIADATSTSDNIDTSQGTNSSSADANKKAAIQNSWSKAFGNK